MMRGKANIGLAVKTDVKAGGCCSSQECPSDMICQRAKPCYTIHGAAEIVGGSAYLDEKNQAIRSWREGVCVKMKEVETRPRR